MKRLQVIRANVLEIVCLVLPLEWSYCFLFSASCKVLSFVLSILLKHAVMHLAHLVKRYIFVLNPTVIV